MGFKINNRGIQNVMPAFVRDHPGLTPHEMQPLLKEQYPTLTTSTISATLSNIMLRQGLNRVKVPHSLEYRYYPKNHGLPEGHTRWDNRLNNRVMKKETTVQPQPQQTISVPTPRKDKVSIQSGGVLIVIQWGEKESSPPITVEAAREIYDRLHQMFGG